MMCIYFRNLTPGRLAHLFIEGGIKRHKLFKLLKCIPFLFFLSYFFAFFLVRRFFIYLFITVLILYVLLGTGTFLDTGLKFYLVFFPCFSSGDGVPVPETWSPDYSSIQRYCGAGAAGGGKAGRTCQHLLHVPYE